MATTGVVVGGVTIPPKTLVDITSVRTICNFSFSASNRVTYDLLDAASSRNLTNYLADSPPWTAAVCSTAPAANSVVDVHKVIEVP